MSYDQQLADARAEIVRLLSYNAGLIKIQTSMEAQIERYQAALSWIEDAEPELVYEARKKFSLEQKADPDEGLPTAADVRGILKPNAGQTSNQ